jgi:transposase-like protein
MEWISFKSWRYFQQNIILMLVRWHIAYSLSYRDIEELAKERGLSDPGNGVYLSSRLVACIMN